MTGTELLAAASLIILVAALTGLAWALWVLLGDMADADLADGRADHERALQALRDIYDSRNSLS